MNKNLDKALESALDQEFLWTQDFENPYEEYVFSHQFERNMKDIIEISNHTYVSLGRRRIRKSLCIIRIAVFALVISGCTAVLHQTIL